MTSALDTLLEAARFIELQEQQLLASPPIDTSSTVSSACFSAGGRYHQQPTDGASTSAALTTTQHNHKISTKNLNNGNTISNSIRQHNHQVSSPPNSPVFAATNSSSSGGLAFTTVVGAVLSAASSCDPGATLASAQHNASLYREYVGGVKAAIDGRNGNNQVGTIAPNGNGHHVLSATTEDSSQSSLNLSSSGYLSGSSVNSSLGGTISKNSNLVQTSTSGVLMTGQPQQQLLSPDQHAQIQTPTTTTGGRRRTTSTNSNGGTQRSPCIIRAGTREVHNKLEKHRRAHLKECFEQLKIQLQLKDGEKKKTSNLAILGAAYRHVMSLKRKERELEQHVEQLAKDKINAQKKILNLKRELTAKYDNIDISNIVSDGDIANISTERGVLDSISDSASLSSGRGSTRYSSSSSLSSSATISSPIGSNSVMPNSMTASISPVISSLNTSSNSPHQFKSSSPMPLSLTAKSMSPPSMMRESPIPSVTSSPTSSGLSSSFPPSILSSSSPPNSQTDSIFGGTNIKISALHNAGKLSNGTTMNGLSVVSTASIPANISLVSSSTAATNRVSSPNIIFSAASSEHCISPSMLGNVKNANMPFNLSAASSVQNLQLLSAPKDLSSKNGIIKKQTILSYENRASSPSNMILGNSGSLSGKELKIEKMYDVSCGEQPAKVIKLFNGIALAPVDKDSKIMSSGQLTLSQVVGGGGLVVSPFPMMSASQSLRVIGQSPNGLATIELSSSAPVQSTHQRNLHQQTSQSMSSASSVSAVTSAMAANSPGAQLHKLLVNGTTATAVSSSSNRLSNSPMMTQVSGVPELARLPGGAELNILPTGPNGTSMYRSNGKLAIVNNGISLKSDGNCPSNRSLHVVTPLQAGGTPMQGLTPIVVSQGQSGSNLAHLIASSPQLAGKVNLSVGGQALPLISTQYLSSMKPMVVAVTNNTQQQPTLSSVPPTKTATVTIAGTKAAAAVNTSGS